MFTSQLKPSGSNLSRASPCNWPGSACSISREPKLFREGSWTGGPPHSFQCSLNRGGLSSDTAHEIVTRPLGADSAPTFTAFLHHSGITIGRGIAGPEETA